MNEFSLNSKYTLPSIDINSATVLNLIYSSCIVYNLWKICFILLLYLHKNRRTIITKGLLILKVALKSAWKSLDSSQSSIEVHYGKRVSFSVPLYMRSRFRLTRIEKRSTFSAPRIRDPRKWLAVSRGHSGRTFVRC